MIARNGSGWPGRAPAGAGSGSGAPVEHTRLLSAALLPLAVVAGLGAAGIVAAAAANFAYSVWAVTTFTRSRPLSGALRGLGAQVLSLAATMLLFGVAGVAFGVADAVYRLG